MPMYVLYRNILVSVYVSGLRIQIMSLRHARRSTNRRRSSLPVPRSGLQEPKSVEAVLLHLLPAYVLDDQTVSAGDPPNVCNDRSLLVASPTMPAIITSLESNAI